MKFPLAQDYVAAVMNLKHSVLDPAFNGGSARRKGFGLEVYAGGYSRVFPIDVPRQVLALRCWTAAVNDAEARYGQISTFLGNVKLPYFAEFNYVRHGIRVTGNVFPIIRMEWVHGATLRDYIDAHIGQPDKLNQLAQAFLQMVKDMHQHRIAHGDLQDGNIIVLPSGQLKLIDYDSLFVPALRGIENLITGVPAYQHPLRIKNGNRGVPPEAIDYFSELAIYLSLRALAESPRLWNINAEGLIFSKEDFQNPQPQIFRYLATLPKEVPALAEKLRAFCAESSLNNLVPLEEVVAQAKNDWQGGGLTDMFAKISGRPSSPPPAAGSSPAFDVSGVIRQMPPSNAPQPVTVKVTFDDLAKKFPQAPMPQPPAAPAPAPAPLFRIPEPTPLKSLGSWISDWFKTLFDEVKIFFSKKFAAMQTSAAPPAGAVPSSGIDEIVNKVKSQSPLATSSLDELLKKMRQPGP